MIFPVNVGEQVVTALSGKVMVLQSLCPFSNYVAAMFQAHTPWAKTPGRYRTEIKYSSEKQSTIPEKVYQKKR